MIKYRTFWSSSLNFFFNFIVQLSNKRKYKFGLRILINRIVINKEIRLIHYEMFKCTWEAWKLYSFTFLLLKFGIFILNFTPTLLAVWQVVDNRRNFIQLKPERRYIIIYLTYRLRKIILMFQRNWTYTHRYSNLCHGIPFS